MLFHGKVSYMYIHVKTLPFLCNIILHVPYVFSIVGSNFRVFIYFFRCEEQYEALFVLQGMLGEPPVRLCLTGSGSLDGKHEAVVNV